MQGLYRARAGFAVGVFKFLVKAGHVKGGKIERFCLLHYLNFYLLYDLLTGYADYRVGYPRHHAAYQPEGEKPYQQSEQQRAYKMKLKRNAACLGDRAFACQALHFVGYARGYERAYDRRYAVKDRDEKHGEQNERVGLPHKHECVKQAVKKAAQQLAQIARDVLCILRQRNFFILISASSSGRWSESSGSHPYHHLSVHGDYILSQNGCECNCLGKKSEKKSRTSCIVR